MLELFVGARFKFMARRRYMYMFSGILTLASIVSLIAHGGPRKSIDFTGGSVLYVGFDRPVPVGDVRTATGEARFEGAEVQMAEGGAQAIIRFRLAEGDTTKPFPAFRDRLLSRHAGLGVTLRSLDVVGPKVGKELATKAILAILVSLGLILIYVAFRFTRVSFGIGGVLAEFHDIIIVLGVFSVLNKEVSLTVLAALLTLAGYSINDTIVVFDRIRENMGLSRRLSFSDIIDKSVNETLSRTVLTAGTVMISVLAFYFLGGVVLRDFALAMLIGVIFGTYSSVYVASALALDINTWWLARRQGKPAKAPAPKAPASKAAAQ